MLNEFLQRCQATGMQTCTIPLTELSNTLDIENHTQQTIHLPRLDIPSTATPVDVNGINRCVIEADAGIAECGSFVIDQQDSQLRLASCMAETLVVVLEASRLVASLEDIAGYMEEKLRNNQAGFIAFISGASRTADIERELTIGVHGPRRMHAIIITDR
ncbi:LutC/YkgG family protein [Desulfurispira natronophila]|uniref:L-lactate dehydrogenase complex protein LldG n=1 Tax=Desulfurispira natronophila TaxID=682562 RepID=A0A7W8DHU3_9BACT|nr:LUD domain-containing protein [Desulfurispira natronophila]MBB5022712.1 L-lactate dehydrogenase complex protein LldG [Desulfurispira natronophila]